MNDVLWSDDRIGRELECVGDDGYSVGDVLMWMRDEYQARLDDRQAALDQLRIMYRAAIDKARAVAVENEKLKLEMKQREGVAWW